MKGVYCLIINIAKDAQIKIGSLGRLGFKKGNYCYVGSAQNNIEKRIQRHFSKDKKIYWHIDYLLKSSHVELKKAVYLEAGKEMECKIACMLAKFEEPISRFGSSDCKCRSHLFRLKSLKSIGKIKWHVDG